VKEDLLDDFITAEQIRTVCAVQSHWRSGGADWVSVAPSTLQ
jgi:hypothetical protein